MSNIMSFAKRFVCASLLLGIILPASASSELSTDEQDSLAKEDIASLQVLSELCHQVIGHNPKFQQNMQRLIEQNQHSLSQEKFKQNLSQDHEYQSLLAESKSNSQEMSPAELKAACDEVLNTP